MPKVSNGHTICQFRTGHYPVDTNRTGHPSMTKNVVFNLDVLIVAIVFQAPN